MWQPWGKETRGRRRRLERQYCHPEQQQLKSVPLTLHGSGGNHVRMACYFRAELAYGWVSASPLMISLLTVKIPHTTTWTNTNTRYLW